MKVTYKKNVMTYTKGATRQQIIDFITRRIEKRQEEIDKREWIVKEYNSLMEKQRTDREWLMWVKGQTDEQWNNSERDVQ